MVYYVKIYSGVHDTLRVLDALVQQWPEVEWDIQPCPVDPFLTGDAEADRGINMEEFPMYKATCEDFTIPEEQWVDGEVPLVYRGTKMAVI